MPTKGGVLAAGQRLSVAWKLRPASLIFIEFSTLSWLAVGCSRDRKIFVTKVVDRVWAPAYKPPPQRRLRRRLRRRIKRLAV